ncbi:Global transcription regulator sge1 [Elasticomyces elasticus]|nr:Global transcription regulator sge1 [Elasticomyces elasticus]KAK3629360.1 Global transcription regulator sge1 [Elasticomyces elasticus]KAK4908749.1 Global transcription regulator sge1 [Elasticomyces elasticus]KAK5748678.1 Global transcription regulator sge1 [Elasticomyces elasticus]
MSGGGAGPLVPTFHGFVQNTMDGLVLFEACLSGKLHHVPRRPHDRERSSLIKSGSIFIYEENASGIKRWTDGVAWSPSRILGNFLIYRELEKPFPPGEKKRAIKRKRATAPGEPYPRRDSDESNGVELNTPLSPPSPNTLGEAKPIETPGTDLEKDAERALIGSLVDSYGFRPEGLVKKTMSVSVNGISHHMVSYYKVDDVKNNQLPRPLADPRLANISVRPELYLKQNFRAPVEESEQYAIDSNMNAHPHPMYSSLVGGYGGVRPGQYMGQPYTLPYGMQATTAPVYGAMTGTSWPTQQAPGGAVSYGHRTYNGQPYPTNNYYQSQAGTSPNPAVKTETQHTGAQASAYNAQYASNYASIPRNDNQTTMMQPPYQTPQQAASSFGSMSAHNARSSYGTIMSSPASHGQPQQTYPSASSQQYPVRSPAPSHSMHSAPSGGVAQSPHTGLATPLPTSHTNTSTTDPHMSYQNAPYPVQAPQSNHVTPNMNGLSINGNSSYAAQVQNGHSYQTYDTSTQPYRGSMGTSASVQQYAS